jgi:hypothetical protein
LQVVYTCFWQAWSIDIVYNFNTHGVAVAGSFRDFGYDIRLQSTKKYEGSAIDVGFRVVVTWLPN